MFFGGGGMGGMGGFGGMGGMGGMGGGGSQKFTFRFGWNLWVNLLFI